MLSEKSGARQAGTLVATLFAAGLPGPQCSEDSGLGSGFWEGVSVCVCLAVDCSGSSVVAVSPQNTLIPNGSLITADFSGNGSPPQSTGQRTCP